MFEALEAAIAVAVIQILAIASALWLSARRRLLDRGLPYLVSLAVGVLLATALLHILPESVEVIGNRPQLWAVFTLVLFFMFCFERIFATVTGHPVESPATGESDCGGHHHHSSRPLALIFGGTLHSFVDGVAVAAAFHAGRRIGWLTAFAITLHEIPHRMGDYALLTHLKVGHNRALRMITVVGVAALAGVALVLASSHLPMGHALAATDWLLPISAASFVYIALVNLMPELAGRAKLPEVLLQLLCMLTGAVFVALILRVPGA